MIDKPRNTSISQEQHLTNIIPALYDAATAYLDRHGRQYGPFTIARFRSNNVHYRIGRANGAELIVYEPGYCVQLGFNRENVIVSKATPDFLAKSPAGLQSLYDTIKRHFDETR